MNYVVYKHTDINNKVYIGITKQNILARWKNGYKNNFAFNKAIKEQGWENIKHDVLYIGMTKEQAEQKEKELINFYKNNCYNLQIGGLHNYKLSAETKEKIGLANKGVNNGCYGKKYTETEKNVFREKIGKRVKCIETGIVYLSARLAGQKNNIGCNHITEVCNGKRKTVGGYHWQYV